MIVTFCAGEDEAQAVEVQDTHAQLILEALGLDDIDGHLFGSCPAKDFMGRLLIITAIGRTQRGRTPGFLQKKIGELRDLADRAIAQGVKIIWAETFTG